MLGYLIEIVSGMPFDQFLREHVFGPLGMEDTGFYLPESKAARSPTRPTTWSPAASRATVTTVWRSGACPSSARLKAAKAAPAVFNWGGYFNTQYFADPREKIIGVLMKQTQGQGAVPDDTGDTFRQLVLQAVDD